MPKEFEQCISNGGTVRTQKVGKDKYMRICFKDGKSYAGEVKEKKAKN
jgi:hypothetical protein